MRRAVAVGAVGAVGGIQVRHPVRSAVDADVVVVGAGPAGSHAARLLAAQGRDVILLEEHPTIGRPVQCAGLVHPRVFDHTPFGVEDVHENDLHGAVVHSPDGTRVAFRTEAVQAVAMDRAGFDQRLAAAAQAAGVDLRVATKATGLRVDARHVDVAVQEDGARRGLRCRLVVGADGIRSGVARWAGLPRVAEVVSAYEAELEGCTIPDVSMIPMFAGRRQAPGFFSWIIPVGGDRARAGLAVAPGMNEAAAKRYYDAMFEDPLSRPYLAAAREDHLIIGGIPLGLRPRLVADRVAVVGDAAGMAKPTSGGGIHTGMVAAKHLARIVGPRITDDRLSRGHLLPYEAAVRRTVAPELRKGWRLRHLYKRFTDEDFDRLARLFAAPRAKRVIEKHGDIDYPSRLVLPLLSAQPRLAAVFAGMVLRGGR